MKCSGKMTCDDAVEFIKKLFEIYLESRNFAVLKTMLHSKVSWFGTGNFELCNNYDEASDLLDAEANSWDGHFKIIDCWYKPISINDESCIVYGEIKMVEDGLNTFLLEMDARLTMICTFENSEIKLYHAHFSVPNAAQNQDEFLHKTLVENYDILLEEKLLERTQMLKQKTIELESLANNIYGGVHICKDDEFFTIVYASEGFYSLIGYSLEETKEIFDDKYVSIIFEKDNEFVKSEISKQIVRNNNWSVEYRIKCKDQKIRWVLDKGVFLDNNKQEKLMQCILTDITYQKEQSDILAQKSFQLETITNNIEAAIVRCDFQNNFNIIFANQGLFRMIGYTREQFSDECSNSLGLIIQPDDKHLVDEIYKDIQIVGTTKIYTNRLIKRDGQVIWVLSKGTIVKESDNHYEFHGVITDITEQQEQEAALRVSEKRYEIAMNLSNITMFEYNIVTKDLILYEHDACMYGVSSVTPNGMEEFVSKGIIESCSVPAYREMYRKIHAGEPFAKCTVNTKDKNGVVYTYELSLTNVFDKNGRPIRAIGVRKNISHMNQLKREEEFGKTLVSDKHFLCEADITNDIILNADKNWLRHLNAKENESFFSVIKTSCEQFVSEEHKDMVMNAMSRENIINLYLSGEKLLSFVYKKKNEDSEEHIWYESTMNIIKEHVSGNINIRYYIVDISDRKRKEQKAIEEQRLYETMVAKAIMAYEVNITKNLALSGHEDWENSFGIKYSNEYSKMIMDFARKVVHPEDARMFADKLSRENVIKEFRKGCRIIPCQYRKKTLDSDSYKWYSCMLHLFEDPENNDVKGYSYVEDIHEQKSTELALQYSAEHDALTGFYNKATFEKIVTNFLPQESHKNRQHAFIMIDIDYFKSINDNFGHVFGDAVLSQIANKIHSLFRKNDLIGRIGGDEYAVFLKNIQSEEVALIKAREICVSIKETYYKKNDAYNISASVGVAIYHDYNETYEQLYLHADSALYAAKNNGRNQYCLYNQNIEVVEFEAKRFDNAFLEVKAFGEHMSEYIFRILYESNDKEISINMALSLLGKHLDVGRAYVFEIKPDNKHISNTFEWCNDGVISNKHIFENVEINNKYKDYFDNQGILFFDESKNTNDVLKSLFIPYDVKKLIQFAILKNGEFAGFIGFDQYNDKKEITKKNISIAHSATQILSLFIVEMRMMKHSVQLEKTAMSIVNALDSYAYVCDPYTFEVLFINEKARKFYPHSNIGEICYSSFWKCDTVCKRCPIEILRNSGKNNCSMEIYSKDTERWFKTSASWIDWSDNRRVCLLENVDITKYIHK